MRTCIRAVMRVMAMRHRRNEGSGAGSIFGHTQGYMRVGV